MNESTYVSGLERNFLTRRGKMKSKIYLMMLILLCSSLISGCPILSIKVPSKEVKNTHNILKAL